MADLGAQIIPFLPDLQRFALQLTRQQDRAHDLVQDCVERALHKAGQFEPGTNLRAWLFTMLRNQFINGARRSKIERRYVDGQIVSLPHSEPARQITTVLFSQTMALVAGLGTDERRAMEMIAMGEISHASVAAELGIAVGTVKSRLFRARAKIRQRSGLSRHQEAFAA